MISQTLQIDADTAIATRLYEPTGQARASVVIGGAMGVRQSFYEAFAAWLAGQGYRVTTFDFRGHGDSLQGPLRKVRANLFDWVRDYESVVANAKEALPAQPLYLVGHSLGAQLPGLMRDASVIDGMLGIAAGSGYWRVVAPALKRSSLTLWYLIAPVAVAVCGYFPGRRLGVVGNLPKGAMLQWRRWCLHPQYAMGAEGAERDYAAVRFPIVTLSFTDDEMMSHEGIQQLMHCYANAAPRIETIAPADVQAKGIGHMGFFRKTHQATLWPHAEAVLASFAASSVARMTP